MATPKYKEEFKTANLLIDRLTPYLTGDLIFTPFIKRRIQAQIYEISDRRLHDAVCMYFLFSENKIEQGSALAEHLLAQSPSDEVTWGNYAFCLLNKVSSATALSATLRGFEYTKSPGILEQSLYCANLAADYSAVLSSAAALEQMEKLSMVVNKDNGIRAMLENANLAKESGRIEQIAAIGGLMEKLAGTSDPHKSVTLSPPLDPDDDSDSYLLEMGYASLDTAKCAELNIRLIDERIKAGLDDWRILGSFYHMDKDITQDGGNS